MKLVVDTQTAGQRLDVALAQLAPQYNRSSWQKLIAGGQVSLNGDTARSSQKVAAGDQIKVAETAQTPTAWQPEVIYEDQNVIAFNKPSGMLTHSKGELNPEITIASLVKKWWPADTSSRAGIVHRLDRATSGVIIAAKNDVARVFLQKQFARRTAQKTYLAAVEGKLKEAQYRLEWPIERNPKRPQTFRVGANGKPAVTEVTLLANHGATSTIECRPQTGRTHQIRVHLAHLGHPIVGDQLYGSTHDLNGRILLHAASLRITTPDGQSHTFTAKPPEDIQDYAHEN